MKTHLLLAILVALLTGSVKAQQKKISSIMEQVNKSVVQLQSGQYNLQAVFKRETSDGPPLSNTTNTHCLFARKPSDTLVGYSFFSGNADESYQQLYNGSFIYEMNNGIIKATDVTKYPKKAASLRYNNQTYPFYAYQLWSLQKYQKERPNDMKLLADTIINHEKCWQLSTTMESPETGHTVEYCYINQLSKLPVAILIDNRKIVGNVTERMIYTIHTSDFHPVRVADSSFTLSAFKNYRSIREYTPGIDEGSNKLLPIGTDAPLWKLPVLNGDSIALANLRGKIVVMDFWFKACIPCYEQMLDLQKLKQEWNNEDIVFVSINGRDDPEKAQLRKFLNDRKIDIHSAYFGEGVANAYNVRAYPALYVIGKDGKILYSLDGYTSSLRNDLSNAIKAK